MSNIDYHKIQMHTLALLKKMGYSYISPKAMKKYRASTREVVLKDILLHQLQTINYFEYKGHKFSFSAKNIDYAMDEIDASTHEGVMTANHKISDLLMMGKSFTEEPVNGVKKSFSLRYIDFENVTVNVFHVTENFQVERKDDSEHIKAIELDLVLFINGIPFVMIEIKKSYSSLQDGIAHILDMQGIKDIPHFFKFIQIIVAGKLNMAHYATLGTPENFYAVWEEEEKKIKEKLSILVEDREISQLDKTIVSLCLKERVLLFLASYIIFDAKTKKIARYQQFFAIEKMMQRIQTFDTQGRRYGGLIWHTQGSGKSLTIVMLAKAIQKKIAHAKIVVVTDRKNLDKQIRHTFTNLEVQVSRAKSGRELIEFLDAGKRVVTTLIHKFKKVKHENVVLSDPNIFIMVDEAHRTQNTDTKNSLHTAMKEVFPLACYLGFTGTPLMKKEKSSFDQFGGEIHRYTIDQAVRDKAVLPLLYEGRLVENWVDDDEALKKRFDKIAKYLNAEQKVNLKDKWDSMEKGAYAERRLKMIMLDINEHFKQHIQGTGFEAMLATSSKYEAIKYHKLFLEEGEIKTAFIISAPDTQEAANTVDKEHKQYILEAWNSMIEKYGDEDTYNHVIESDFIKGDKIELLIVVEKLLTGFDAPKASVLYIDKHLQEHNLLQAIARVNRLSEGKDFGFIVDYRGLLGNLDKALNTYAGLVDFDAYDIAGAVFDIKDEIAKVKIYDGYLRALFSEIKHDKSQEAYQVLLKEKEKRKLFYTYLSYYARALKLALSSDKIDMLFSDKEINDFRKKLQFYNELHQAVKIRYHEKVDFGKYERQIQKLFDTFITEDTVRPLSKLVNIFDPAFDNEIEQMRGDNAKADAILFAAMASIQEKSNANPAYYERLSLRISEILENYIDQKCTAKKKLKEAKAIKRILFDISSKDTKENYPDLINSVASKAFYDNISHYFAMVAETMPSYGNKSSSTILTEIILKIDLIFQEASKKPDWKSNKEVRKRIEGKVEALIWELEDKYFVTFDHIDTILEKIYHIGVHNYV